MTLVSLFVFRRFSASVFCACSLVEMVFIDFWVNLCINDITCDAFIFFLFFRVV